MARTPSKQPADPLEFAFEKYKLDRSHEIELNKATHNFEQESLKTLSFLNGGAAALYIGLLGKGAGGIGTALAAGAVGSWAIGLLLAASATWSAYHAQVKFTQAYHARRRAEEKRRFVGHKAYENVTNRDYTEAQYDADAGRLGKEGKAGVESVKKFGLGSVLLFCLGLAMALISVL
jgi:hypothetical protein